MNSIEELQKLIDESSNIVFFGGAGVSTESGIKDFRSVDGLYHEKYDYPPETILSHSFYVKKKEEFFRFYKDKLLVEGVEPNAAHYKLAELEQKGKLKAVITQNIDGLHQKAGSKKVLELHGTVMNNYCENCGKRFSIDEKFTFDDLFGGQLCPKCDECGGDIKPDVVLYEEGLDNYVLSESIRCISEADMLIVGGTSLVVYPAAGLIDYYRGKKLVLINMDTTPRDSMANYVFKGKIGEILSQIKVN